MARSEPLIVGTSRAAVLGHPIGHSLSPVLHRAAYADLGLDWRYDAVEVDEGGLAGFLDRVGPEWIGLSLTMPLKRTVLPLLDDCSALVTLVGAANTVVLGPDGRVGHNTDVAGIVTALRGSGAPVGDAVVLGAGATAASAVAALAELGTRSVLVHARRPGSAAPLRALAEAIGIDLAVAGWPDRMPDRGAAPIVISTVPSGASLGLAAGVPKQPGWLLDVAYDPWPGELVLAWRAGGGVAVSGDEMLLHQAVGQVALWAGRTPDVAVMRAALHAELARRTGANPV